MTESNPASPSKNPEEALTQEVLKKYALTFELDNGVIETGTVKSLSLPRIVLESQGNVDERSSIILLMHPSMKAARQILYAASIGFEHFKIIFKDGNLKVHSTWVLHDASVKGLDLGSACNNPNELKPDLQCEIRYEMLEIDGVKL